MLVDKASKCFNGCDCSASSRGGPAFAAGLIFNLGKACACGLSSSGGATRLAGASAGTISALGGASSPSFVPAPSGSTSVSSGLMNY